MLHFVRHCRHNKEKREGPLGTGEVQEARLSCCVRFGGKPLEVNLTNSKETNALVAF